jgi:hypothetical protein
MKRIALVLIGVTLSISAAQALQVFTCCCTNANLVGKKGAGPFHVFSSGQIGADSISEASRRLPCSNGFQSCHSGTEACSEGKINSMSTSVKAPGPVSGNLDGKGNQLIDVSRKMEESKAIKNKK